LDKPSADCWYQARPMGHNSLGKIVKMLCEKAGCDGYYTNHSLQRMCATRLYNNGIDEQQIMSVTGHCSSNAVRVYKNISLEQQEKMSKILQGDSSLQVKTSDIHNKENVPTGNQLLFLFNSYSVTINNK
jgi:integrase